MSNNLQRVLVALVGIPAVIAIVYWGGLALAILVAVVAGLGAIELTALAKRQGIQPVTWLAVLLSVLVPIGIWIGYDNPPVALWVFTDNLGTTSPWVLLAVATIVTLTVTLASRPPDSKPLAGAAITLLAPLYCGLLPSFLQGIRYSTQMGSAVRATAAVLFPLAITWIGDTVAMYGGRAVGGPKLAPVVSPGKTRSGSAFGLVGGIVTAVLFNRFVMYPDFDLTDAQAILFGLVISVAAQVGDLAESLFKRDAGVKDSGTLLPGHGGILDRLDAMYFTVPAAAILYQLFGIL